MMSRIEEISGRVKSGEISATEVVLEALSKADEFKEYNALISLTRERALERAKVIDEKIKSGKDAGRLAGVPFVVKDNFLAFGSPTTAAAPMLEDFEAPIQAEAIERLESEGAICIGKANLDAFAHGGSTENSTFGPTLNAVDKTKVAGGSSGGSAVAVALGIVPFALGTDTGGSIRQPSSFNGVVGVKPTYGTISRYGVIAMASSTDTVGCITSSVRDGEIVMEVMSGKDEKDMTTFPDFFKVAEPKPGQRVGIIKDFMLPDVDDAVKGQVLDYVERLKKAGHVVDEVELPVAKYALAIYYIIVPAEVSSNLARYDGVRYGKRAEGVDSIDSLYGKSREQGFEFENKRRIIIGSYVLSSGLFDAYYLKAAKARTVLINAFNDLLEEYDALIGPVSSAPAFDIGANIDDPVKMYLTDMMTVPASLAGLPAISVPAGTTPEGLPVGVQLIGRMKSDAELLALAREMEEAKT